MITYYRKEGRELQTLEARAPSCWIHIAPPFTHEELERISRQLDIPLDFLTDSLDIDERSRYEREDGVRLIVLNTPSPNKTNAINAAIYITVPIGIILASDYILTITAFENPVLQRFLDNKIKNFDPAQRYDFVLKLLEQNVYYFLTCLKDLNNRRNQIEKELYEASGNTQLKQLLSMEKSLVYFVTSLSANDLLMMKMKRTDFLSIRDDEDLVDLLDDIVIDNGQANEMANVYASILSGTMNAFASIISNNLNLVIQRLTLITIILMVPTLVASFFGMNVPNGMENKSIAFPVILILSIILSVLVAWIFRRRRLF